MAWIYIQIARAKEVLEELCSIVEQETPDIVLIAGDIYDQINPPVEAVYLLHQTLMKMSANGKRAIIIIAGNHDSPERIEAIEPLLFESGIIVAGWPYSSPACYSIPSGISIISSGQGFVELQLPNCKYPVRILLGAYANTLRCTPLLSPENQDIQLILKIYGIIPKACFKTKKALIYLSDMVYSWVLLFQKKMKANVL